MSHRFAYKEDLGVAPYIEAIFENMTLDQVKLLYALTFCMPLSRHAAQEIVKGNATVSEMFGEIQIH